MESRFKEVDFKTYCATCAFKDYPEHKDPCHECLNNPVNEYSKKPVEYKPKA